jgi:hypothetical protein
MTDLKDVGLRAGGIVQFVAGLRLAMGRAGSGPRTQKLDDRRLEPTWPVKMTSNTLPLSFNHFSYLLYSFSVARKSTFRFRLVLSQ